MAVMMSLAAGLTQRDDALPLAFESNIGSFFRDCRHDIGSFDFRSGRHRHAFGHSHGLERGDALLAGIFNHPFERRDCLCHRLLHQLSFREHVRTAAWNP